MSVDCCWIAIILAIGNIVCWLVFFSGFFIKINAKDKVIEFKAHNASFVCKECKKKKGNEIIEEQHNHKNNTKENQEKH